MSWLFDSLVNWLTDALGDVFSTVSGDVLLLFSLDKAYFDENVPYIVSIQPILKGLGLGIAVLILLISLSKNMLGEFADSYESPLRLIGGFFASCICVLMGDGIVNMEFNMFANAYMKLLAVGDNSAGAADAAGGVPLHFAGPGDALKGIGTGLVGLILLIMLIVTWFKLLLEAVQRYVVIMVCFYFSPLAMSTLVSKKSSSIFSAYIRLVFSQLLLMLMNIIFLKAVASAMNMASDNEHPLLGIIFIIAIAMVGQMIDTYFKSLGLDVVQTGGRLGSAVMGTAMGMAISLPKLASGLSKMGSGVMEKWGAGQGMAKIFPGLQQTALGTAAGKKGFNNFARTAEGFSKSMANQNLSQAAANGNVDGKTMGDLINGKKVGNTSFGDMKDTMFANSDQSKEALRRATADSKENPFEKIPGLDDADISLGQGKASATLENGAEIGMRKLGAGELPPQNATTFDVGGEKWCATPMDDKHAPINSNNVSGSASFGEAFGAQAEAMQASTNGASSVTQIGEGVYRANDGTVFASTSYGNNGAYVGGAEVSGSNMMDGYRAYKEADVAATPFAEDGYYSETGMGRDYINSYANDNSFSNAMKSCGQNDDFNVTQIAHGDDSTFSFKTSTGGEFACYDTSQYQTDNGRTPVVNFGGNEYYVAKSSDVSQFVPRGNNISDFSYEKNASSGVSEAEHTSTWKLPNGKKYIRRLRR